MRKNFLALFSLSVLVLGLIFTPSIEAQHGPGFKLMAISDPVVPLLPPSAAACGSSPHCVVLTWTAPADVVATSTYNVYQLTGACPATAPATTPDGFTKVNTAAVTALTFTQDLTNPGSYCYFVTQVQNGAESNPSNDVSAVILPLAPTMSAPVAN